MKSGGCFIWEHVRERRLHRSCLLGKARRVAIKPCSQLLCELWCHLSNADYCCLRVGVKGFVFRSPNALVFLNCRGKRRDLHLPVPHSHEQRPGKFSWEAAVEPSYKPCSPGLPWVPAVNCALLGCMEPHCKLWCPFLGFTDVSAETSSRTLGTELGTGPQRRICSPGSERSRHVNENRKNMHAYSDSDRGLCCHPSLFMG